MNRLRNAPSASFILYFLVAYVVLSFALVVLLPPFYYESPEVSASVIDVETRMPIAGAVIIIITEVEKRRMLHGSDDKVLQRLETVTDQSGKFRVDGWGPKFVGVGWNMVGSSPRAYVLKSGYKFEVVSNYTSQYGGLTCPGSKIEETTGGIPIQKHSFIVTSWNMCPIELKPPTENLEEAASKLSMIRRRLCDSNENKVCSELLIQYLAAEERRLLALGARINR